MQNSIINTLFVVVVWWYKKKNMKPTSHHEILLLAGTTLAKKQLANSAETDNDGKLRPIEELERACWNGILYEMFPEILGNGYQTDKDFLWHVLTGKNFLYITVGSNPLAAEHDSSIDPYFFMMKTCEN